MTGPCLGCLAAADHGVASCADCRAVLVAVPKPTRTERARRKLRPVNGPRRRRALARDFGDLAVFVRTLPCCVAGCGRDSVPAHVVGRSRGHAWLEVDGAKVGNIAPLCCGHHTGAPGFTRPQHTVGIPTFERENRLELRLPDWVPRSYATLAEVAAAVGRTLLEGAP